MTLSEIATEQYGFVTGSRRVLFDYCKTVSAAHFLDQNTSFGRGGSMRNLLVHIANTYEFWIGKLALKEDIAFTHYESKNSISEVAELFNDIDQMMKAFISSLDENSTYELSDNKGRVSGLKLFTHVITHEYHHKGQVLSLSRHLGYVPVDTDIMR